MSPWEGLSTGKGLAEAFASGIKREDVFVVSKVWATYTTRCELGLQKSLEKLGLDYVDLFLVVGAPDIAGGVWRKRQKWLTRAVALAFVDEP